MVAHCSCRGVECLQSSCLKMTQGSMSSSWITTEAMSTTSTSNNRWKPKMTMWWPDHVTPHIPSSLLARHFANIWNTFGLKRDWNHKRYTPFTKKCPPQLFYINLWQNYSHFTFILLFLSKVERFFCCDTRATRPEYRRDIRGQMSCGPLMGSHKHTSPPTKVPELARITTIVRAD